ncbi:MAG: tRNA pseudouridine(55) synthase TruB [Pseudomonadota bacterium]
MGRRKRGLPVHGILILDKPQGCSSNGALQRCKRMIDAQKAGHTGALDPMATGVLPICFGDATKFSQYLLDADKAYEATVCLGSTTDTGDAEGEIINRRGAAMVTRALFETALEPFRGEIEQVPPMYSALKRDGQPLYKLARQGITVERQSRTIRIHRLECVDFYPGEAAQARIVVMCSKGTYIRSLAEDIGASLGCGAHLTGLRRTAAGPFGIEQAVTMAQVEAAGQALTERLLPIDAGLEGFDLCQVDEKESEKLLQGQSIKVPNVPKNGIVRVARASSGFIGLATASEGGVLSPLRMIATGV